MKRIVGGASVLAFTLLASVNLGAQEPIVGLPCEGCEAVFQGLPSSLPTQARIAEAGEPGQPMRIIGRALDADGQPRSGIVIYAYQTDATGIYPAPATPTAQAADQHGRLRAWVQSDADGRYQFTTIRPASYPNQKIPAHIHLHVIEPRCATYYIDDITFTDDPLLKDRPQRKASERGGNGLVTPAGGPEGWQVNRDIRLGMNIPGYPECDAGRAK